LFYIWGVKKGIVVLFLVWCIGAWGQNLVPNPGFENYTGCQINSVNFDSIQYWRNPTNGSPDYFKACANVVPSNWACYQYPHSGNCYVGLVIKNSGCCTEWREYIQSPLISPLVIGQLYRLSMYTNLSNFVGNYGSSSIAALFTTYPLTYNSNYAIPITPQAVNDSADYVTDTLDWKLIQMTFIADSNYSYVTIGNFLTDSLTTYVLVQNTSYPRAYFLLDDISLNRMGETNIVEFNKLSSISIYPNPTTSNSTLTFTYPSISAKKEIIIYSIHGKEIARYTLPQWSSTQTAKLPQMAGGVYVARMVGENESAMVKFVVE
jgi:hypothetical protein